MADSYSPHESGGGIHQSFRNTCRCKYISLLLASLAVILWIFALTATSCRCNSPPYAAIISIIPAQPCVGEMVTFNGSATDADGIISCWWESSLDGSLGRGQSISVTSLSEGVHHITFCAGDSHGEMTCVGTLLTVVRQQSTSPPVIESFNASPQRIEPQRSSTLSWRVSGARTVRIDPGIGDVTASGSRDVLPTADTTYTLTASNEQGSVTANVQVRIIVMPVIESFTATPDRIDVGSSSTLTWTARNATRASLSATSEPGSPGYTQSVSLSGSQNVSPTSTTFYTLTATNDFGTDTRTVQVTVWRRPAPEGNPDLVITDIRKVETPDGYRISYTIKNQGAVVAGASTTKLYASGRYWDSDSVQALQPGMWVTRQFSDKLYNPAYNNLEGRADADNTVREGNEQNNATQVVIPLDVGYDFVANAAGAAWTSGSIATTTTTAPATTTHLSFGGSTNDDRGFVCYLNNARMEDGRTYPRVLVTHPKWVYNGYIQGLYPVTYRIRPGDYFVARIGIAEGRTAGRVKVNVIYSVGLTQAAMFEREEVVIYNNNIETISYRFPVDTFGKIPSGVILRISTDGESTQDWASWIEAKIVR